ncbi:MAG: hypothetical protein CLLPBCKN_008169 [Chroococcidiopsis cubana SAG 39.79]|uniref:tetratricopeptide repeat protein n=1 Tax=Chroococcidiopsis cubana TaxID=171392 RepID=UPI002AC5C8D2|nr:tetratricopeptide repeat protein [Chroococcidiopsis cubana]MDZ4878732.1 hypothetical protein [Chroococcidiopsis cubana SAG 39.79]
MLEPRRLPSAIELDRNNLNAYLGLGVISFRLRDYDGAAEAYQQVLNRDSNNAYANELMGLLLLEQGEYDAAGAALQKQ